MEKKDLGTRAENTLAACAEAIERLSSADSWREEAPEVLRMLGTAVEADRASIFRNFRDDDGALLQEYMFEWSAPAVMASIELPGAATWPYEGGLERWVEVLGSGQTIQGPADELPTGEQAALDLDIVSLCIVPIFVGHGWWGYLGFDDCRERRDWTTVEIAALRTGAAAIGSAVDREHLDEERHSAELYLRSHLEHLPAITYIETMDAGLGREDYVSPQIEGMLGCTQEAWIGDHDLSVWKEMIHPEDKKRVEQLFGLAKETGEPYLAEYRLKNRVTSQWVWVRDQASLVATEGDAPYWHGVMVDITAQKLAEERLAWVAQHDRLTDLPNRPMFEQLLDLALARARRGNLGIAVLYIDLDNFKLVNNSLGHEAGDDLIRQLAERVRGAVRDTDLVARQGADEFLVLLADIEPDEDGRGSDGGDELRTAESVVTRIQGALSSPFEISGAEVFATASIGVSLFPSSATDAQDLLSQADSATYRSKQTGPGGYAIFSAEADEALEELSFRTRLRRATEDKVWSLNYQPLVESDTGRMIGVEALLRWKDPELGFISPGEFIPLAEETGLIVPIGEWVAEELFRQARVWHEQGIELEEISFNVSPRQLWQPKLVETIVKHLEASSIDAGRVVIEITETAAMIDPDRTHRILWDLHARGFRLAIDDFGTGYSSLSRLKSLPISILKIDRAFVMDIPEDPDAVRMVAAIVALAKSLDMRPLAEGIETVEQKRFLVESGCELGQGYFFSRPLPPVGIEEIHGRGGVTTMADDTAP